VINEHGDNRGDEAALRAMLEGLAARLTPVRFTVLHQFASPDSEADVPQNVTWLPIVIPPVAAVRLALAFVCRVLGLPARGVAGTHGRRVVDAFESADIVVSAPGGPYFGDIYKGHEPVHWFYVWMAWAYGRPSVLYAPSAGPFDIRWRNPFRRWTIRRFAALAVREQRSAHHIETLLGLDRGSVEVTADAAFQRGVESAATEPPSPSDDRMVLVVSAAESRWDGHADPARCQDRYDVAIVGAIESVAANRRVHVVFPPQLHGPRRTDRDYLLRLADRLPESVTWEVLASDATSDDQQRRFAASDLVLAGRYHPAVFAIRAGVPLVVLAYEHKAVGLMEDAGLGDLVLWNDDVTSGALVQLVRDTLDRDDEVRARVQAASRCLVERSTRTNDLVERAIAHR
jgi:polysaccharide pyruvyl transferase WcaK-like protein